MRTVLYRRYGDAADVLDVETVSAPSDPTEGEVAIRVLTRPVHHGNLLGIAGRYRSPGDLSEVPAGGRRPGFEGMGIVEAVGPGVTRAHDLKVGDRVTFFPALGAWSERLSVPARFVTRLHDRISDETAAQLHVNPMTALLLMRAASDAGVTPDKGAIMVTAVGAGVAKLTIALALKKQLTVVGVVRRAQGRDELARLFPGLPVVVTDQADWPHAVRLALGERTVGAAFDCVGGVTAAQAFSMLETGGTMICYGDLAGAPMPIPALPFSTRGLRIRGISVGGWGGLSDKQRQQDLKDAMALALERPDLFAVSGTYELAEARTAAAHVRLTGKSGTVLLTSL